MMGLGGVGGMAVDGSMGMQRACGSAGVADAMVRVCGAQWWRHMGYNSRGIWGIMVGACGM